MAARTRHDKAKPTRVLAERDAAPSVGEPALIDSEAPRSESVDVEHERTRGDADVEHDTAMPAASSDVEHEGTSARAADVEHDATARESPPVTEEGHDVEREAPSHGHEFGSGDEERG